MAYQASPKFIAPRHRGDTLTPAVGDRMRWYPRTLFGVAAGLKAIFEIRYWYAGKKGWTAAVRAEEIIRGGENGQIYTPQVFLSFS